METLPSDLTSLLADLRTALENLYGDRLIELRNQFGLHFVEKGPLPERFAHSAVGR